VSQQTLQTSHLPVYLMAMDGRTKDGLPDAGFLVGSVLAIPNE
jgi:hypothetical protein